MPKGRRVNTTTILIRKGMFSLYGRVECHDTILLSTCVILEQE